MVKSNNDDMDIVASGDGASDQSNNNLTKEKANQAKKDAIEAKLLSASVTEVISVLLRSETHRNLRLSDLEWLVFPAVQLSQYRLAGSKVSKTTASLPVGLILWANVSDKVDKRLAENLDRPLRLTPEEWNGGDNTWLIEGVGDRAGTAAIFRHLLQTTFEDRPVKAKGIDDDGKKFVKVFEDHIN